MDVADVKLSILVLMFEQYNPHYPHAWHSLEFLASAIPFEYWHHVPQAVDDLVQYGILHRRLMEHDFDGEAHYLYQLKVDHEILL